MLVCRLTKLPFTLNYQFLEIFQIIMSDEIEKAQTAKPTEDTIFGKIARKEIKVDLIHDDDQVDFVIILYNNKLIRIILFTVCCVS